MSGEKRLYPEIQKSLSAFGGLAYKMVQDAIICPRCKNVVHPFHAGWPDFHAEIPCRHNIQMAIKVEVKSGEERFNFRELREDQIEWARNYNGITLLWLSLGNKRVLSNDYMARRAWLVPFSIWVSQMDYIKSECGVEYIPINKTAIDEYNMRYRDKSLTASLILEEFELEWSAGIWRPNRSHFLWNYEPERSYDKFVVERN